MEYKLQDSEKKRHFSTLYDSRDEKKNQKPYCTSTRHTLSYPRVSFFYYLKFRWSSNDNPYTTENVIFPPSYDPRG